MNNFLGNYQKYTINGLVSYAFFKGTTPAKAIIIRLVKIFFIFFKKWGIILPLAGVVPARGTKKCP